MEEIKEQPIRVFVEVDNNNYIVKVFSSDFEEPTKTSIQIDEGFGDKFRHAQSQYFDKSLINEDRSCNYKLENGKVKGV